MQVHFQNTTFEHDKLTFKGNLERTESTTMTFFAKHFWPNYMKLFSCIYMTNSSVSFFWEGNDAHYLQLNVDEPQGDPE